MPDITYLDAHFTGGGMISPPPTPSPRYRDITKKEWDIQVSPAVAGSSYAIRLTVERITGQQPESPKEIINLGIGDPTIYPLHLPPQGAIDAVQEALESGKANGYLSGPGSPIARKAVADYHKQHTASGKLSTSSFTFYSPLAISREQTSSSPAPSSRSTSRYYQTIGVDIRYYDCIEADGWQIDIRQLDGLCDAHTRAILITNPGNPCGSNFSSEHLHDILAVAERHKVPIIADEIYGHMTWDEPFIPLASISNTVPIMTLSGLSKRFLVPGWRVGWLALHDPLGVAGAVKDGIQVWGNRFFGPSHLSQAALPKILATPASWFEEVNAKIKVNADIISSTINSIPGLSGVRATGSLYMLVKIDFTVYPTIEDDVEWSVALYREQAVFVLPGDCFSAPGYFRVVLATPEHITQEVAQRLILFSDDHRFGIAN